MMDYDVIIIGGGPVGVALGIELGLRDIKTLILEKHARPLHTPRAQSLSARTMEFFLRWGIDKTLEDNLLLPRDLPQTGIWCSSLCDEPYFIGCWGDNKLDEGASPKEGVRIPLWVTEEVLRKRLLDFPSVTFLKSHDVQGITYHDDHVSVQSFDKIHNVTKEYGASYLACCDGATGLSKAAFNNRFTALSEKSKMLGTVFISHDIMEKKSVPDGIMYFVISDEAMAFVGPIDLKKGLWLAQFVCKNNSDTPDDAALSTLIDKMVGTPVDKEIVDSYCWDMQVQLADFFSFDNRVFWLGDAAHAFAPTGGLGLNTGFGDAQNLGWKLASVINKEALSTLLSTYEVERRPVCINNLNFAKQNAAEFIEVKTKFPPSDDLNAFAMASADLGNRFLSSSGLTLGYGYFDSPLTQRASSPYKKHDPFNYTPIALPGYFLPHRMFQGAPIYEHLSPTQWTLIICGKENMSSDNYASIKRPFSLNEMTILHVDAQLYPYTYLLIRPDWHIASVGQYTEQNTDFVQEKCS